MKFIAIIALILSSIVSAARDYHFVVAADGRGDFRTVQEAIEAVPDFRKNETVIFIRKGIYKEKLTLAASKTNVTFIGEDRDSTILTWDDFASKKNRFGEEIGTKQSSAQITRLYTPEELVGRQVLGVVNFPPRKVADFSSEVLVLGVYADQGGVLIQPDQAGKKGDKLG